MSFFLTNNGHWELYGNVYTIFSSKRWLLLDFGKATNIIEQLCWLESLGIAHYTRDYNFDGNGCLLLHFTDIAKSCSLQQLYDVIDQKVTLSAIGKNPSNQQTCKSVANNNSNGCYIATCVYGSYDCPEVWALRRFRDQSLNRTLFGRLFIKIYYVISPKLVQWFGSTRWFRFLCRKGLDPFVQKLKASGYKSSPYDDTI